MLFLWRGRGFIEETVPWDVSLLVCLSTSKFIPWHLSWKLRKGTEDATKLLPGPKVVGIIACVPGTEREQVPHLEMTANSLG